MLRRIDTLTADVATLDERIDALIAPYISAVDKLDEIPGIGHRSAQELIAEIGVTMTAFPTAARAKLNGEAHSRWVLAFWTNANAKRDDQLATLYCSWSE
jgi:hypothetical protein